MSRRSARSTERSAQTSGLRSASSRIHERAMSDSPKDSKDYKATLNLPQTEFPMKGNLGQLEPKVIASWEEKKVFEQVLAANKGKPEFTLHDGPPYANGRLHAGHALNKILKDIVVKYRNLAGFRADFMPGWDTHGLPIEQAV